MRRSNLILSAYLLILSGLMGCPPTGDPPPFEPSLEPDKGGRVDAATDVSLPDIVVIKDAEPDQGPPAECLDSDDDGYVEGIGCALPAGDCAPTDPSRNPGVMEACNLRDDNCNGQIDENDPEGGEDCETTIPGVCRAGRTACVQGSVECKQIQNALPSEACNGLDDNCNGQIDEGNPEGGADCQTGQPGLCARGVQRCEEAALRCLSDYTPVAELCNGEDDDCNGEEDEGDPGGGGACDTELDGVCAIGEERCQGGGLTCVATQTPVAERCDGRDDDCNGTPDDPWQAELGQACAVGEGACYAEGVYVCAEDGQGVSCQATPGAGSPERCDGVDNDCDTEIDETFPVGDVCTIGIGACAADGAYVCAEDGEGVICEGVENPPSDEICNEIDDDCDTEIDETFLDKGEPCDVGVGACLRTGAWVCGEDGDLVCDATAGAEIEEICNEIDDDCDAEIDETFLDKGEPCSVGLGECVRAGEWVCGDDGGLTCSVEAGPQVAELCDQLDNDCDGRVDNGAPCHGRPMGRVDSMRIAEEAASAVCRDFNEDGAPDNGLSAVAALLNGPLSVSILEGQRALYLQAFDQHLAVMEGDPSGPLPRAFDERGVPNTMLPVVWEDDTVFSALPFAEMSLVSPSFYDRGARSTLSLLPFYSVNIAADTQTTDEGLSADTVLLTGTLLRAEMLDAYATAEALCLGAQRFTCGDDSVIEAARWCDGVTDCADSSDENTLGCEVSLFSCGILELQRGALCDGVEDCEGGEDESLTFCRPEATLPGCDIFDEVPFAILEANLQADLDLDDDGEFEAVSACFILSLEATPSLPDGGQPCQVDDDCYAGLLCRPVAAGEGPLLHLARRCERPAGVGAQGDPCDQDEDCMHGFCLAFTAAGGVCSNLCEADDDCFEGALCRGLAAPLPQAPSAGGRTMRACQPTSGSQAACDHDCEGDEVCALYFDDGAGDPEATVGVVGHCEAPHPEGVALGEVCERGFDCVHGGGCATIENTLGCAQPCAQPASCSEGQMCMEIPLMGEAEVVHPSCVPIDGSALPCTGGLDCEAGELCAPAYLTISDTVERACLRGEGFFGVGVRCTDNEECASSLCLGYCSDYCLTHADCGPNLACRQGAAVNEAGVVLGGLCAPAEEMCQGDNDCREDPSCCDEDDPNCLSNRCVCDAGQCRIGCRPGGTCGEGLVCLDDGRCALYCRDDADEGLGNDVMGAATVLTLDRSSALHSRVGHLCAASPVDWYAFNHSGVAPFRLEVSPVDDAASLMEVELFDGFGQSVERLDFVDGAFVFEQTLEEARAQRGQLIHFRIRATGFERGFDYNLAVDMSALIDGCPDPDNAEPRDVSWEPYEVLTNPQLNAQEVVDGRLCAMDEDWYKFWLSDNDTVVVNLERLDGADPQPGNLELRLIGPDHPVEAISGELNQLIDNGQIQYTATPMTCDSSGSKMCQFDNGVLTNIFCYGDNNCTGITYSLQVRTDDPLSEIPYRLSFGIQRAEALLCVPDFYEQNYTYMDVKRYHSMLPPEARIWQRGTIISGSGEGNWATFPRDTPLVFSMRACGAEQDFPDVLADRDTLSFWMDEGEVLEARVAQANDQTQDLELHFVQWVGGSVSAQETLSFSDPRFEAEYVVPEDSLYGAVIVRQKNAAMSPNYAHDLAYELTLIRHTASGVAEQDCDSLGTAINFLFGPSSTVAGTTLGHLDDHQPLACEGGDGPDRVYAVELPAGQSGTLDATVVAQGESDPAVSIRTDCAVSFSEQACNEDDLEAARPDRQAHTSAFFQGGQRVFVIVDSYDADSAGPFLLTLDWTRQ